MAALDQPRLLVVVVAYEAEATLEPVLARIPKSVFEDFRCEVLVVDDASTDRTFEIGRAYRDANPHLRVTVLRNQFSQGYGGNQKVGYAYAMQEGFDVVALLHADGQYAPEELPHLLEPLRSGEADAVLGSRMMPPKSARHGGMPLYKFIGNRALSAVQNRLLGTRFSELHSGYRLYAVKMLARLPFRLNSNGFTFDTELLVQLLEAKARIVERPIPTYHRTPLSRAKGLTYAKDVFLTTLRTAVHRTGILYQRRFDVGGDDNVHYDLKLGYASSHTYALEAVPADAKVLDMGSGPLGIARELVARGLEPTVVDRVEPEHPDPKIHVLTQDLDEPLALDIRPFDTLLLLDIIEHLKNPEQFLERLRTQFEYAPKRVIITTPNVAFFAQRFMLLLGQFNYGKAGILDRTHTRLFTFRSLSRLLKDVGMRVVRVRGVPAPFPKVLGNGLLGRTAVQVNLALIRLSKTLFSYQIFVEAETTPDLAFVLRDTHKRSAPALEVVPSEGPRQAAASTDGKAGSDKTSASGRQQASAQLKTPTHRK